ncbi:PTPLA-domain-containing protein [Aureobasidium sp. EXF-8845]|nr:PTPLA-domain-containing protein [Aureobasidium sp. EXF-8845]KAI4854345.1 PTPLA-domain-containing protein [Aureobasidium sp. EXF-8846]
MADRPQESVRVARERKSSPVKTGYLVLYNAVSTILWATILGRVLLVASVHGTKYVFPAVGEFAKWTQTLALLEVVHAAVGEFGSFFFGGRLVGKRWRTSLKDGSYNGWEMKHRRRPRGQTHEAHTANTLVTLTGIVRAPLFTTLMQVASRILLIWGIVHPFPSTVAYSPIYSSMLIAWSVTEVIRYSYFAINLSTGSVPNLWLWLRYNTFFVLYPLGISSECALVWKAAVGPAKSFAGVREGLFAILLIYVPGSYILFTHMMAQRRKVMRGSHAKTT